MWGQVRGRRPCGGVQQWGPHQRQEGKSHGGSGGTAIAAKIPGRQGLLTAAGSQRPPGPSSGLLTHTNVLGKIKSEIIVTFLLNQHQNAAAYEL